MAKFNLEGKLNLDGSGFTAGMNKAKGSVKSFAGTELKNMAKAMVSAFAVGAIIRSTRDLVTYGEKIFDLNKRTGISTDTLQKLDFAATQTGSSLDVFVKSFEKLNKTRSDAMRGLKISADALAVFGLSLTQLKNLSTDEIVSVISDELKRLGGNARQTAAIMDIFGRGGLQLLPLLMDDFDSFGRQLEDMGGIIEKSLIDKLKHTGDQMTNVQFQSRAMFATMITWAGKAVEAIGDTAAVFGALSANVDNASFRKTVVSALRLDQVTAIENDEPAMTGFETVAEGIADKVSKVRAQKTGASRNQTEGFASIGALRGSVGQDAETRRHRGSVNKMNRDQLKTLRKIERAITSQEGVSDRTFV
jgi:hypothetical protein